MAQFTDEEYQKVKHRGFEPADGFNPLYFTECHNVDYPNFQSIQTSDDVPYRICDLGTLNTWWTGNLSFNEHVWKSIVPSADTSVPPGAVGLHVVAGSHLVGADTFGDLTIYFTDEDGNDLPNSFYITAESINQIASLHDKPIYLTMCYREDITPPQLLFGVCYTAYYQDTFGYHIATDRAIQLGYQGIGTPNEPFLSWYLKNADSSWYDEESQVPEMTEGGGGGAFFRENSNIGTTPLPTFNMCATNFMRTYKLTTAQLSDFGNYCWDTNFFNSIVKNWQSPFENIIALNLMPLDTELATTNETIQIGNVDTGVTASRVTTQCYKLDMGEINVKEFYANFADYAPYSKLAIMLPMIGKRELNPDEYMNGKIHLYYNIDVITGTCVAELIAIKNGYYHLVDAYQGNIATQIPITGTNYLQAYSQIASGLVGMSSGMAGGLVAGVNSILTAKPSYEKSGSFSGSASRLTTKKPYIFFDTPQLKAPDTFRSLHGYVSNQYAQLGTCKGYTVVKYMDMKNISLTASEKDELKQILETGVYINDPPTTP